MENGGNCKCVDENQSKVVELVFVIITNTWSIFIDGNDDSANRINFGFRNLSGVGCCWEYGNFGMLMRYNETAQWQQGRYRDPRATNNTVQSGDKDILAIAGMGTASM